MARPLVSTYRLQLRQGFGLREAAAAVPTLARLGVDTLYLSPVFQARVGSTHGYDVTDPTVADPAIGSMLDFLDLAESLRSHGMGLLVDLVPNHMAASIENPWWADVLEQGTASPQALWFAIDWAAGRLVLPVLPRPLSRCKPRIELTAAGFRLRVLEQSFPLSMASCEPILLAADRGTGKGTGKGGGETARQLRKVTQLAPLAAKDRLWRLYQGECRAPLDKAMRQASLGPILRDQAYRLEAWREGLDILRHRRFFDIADLVGLRVDRPEVFRATHELALAWARAGLVTALRIDHVDGLRDPKGYLDRLHQRLPPGTPVLVEKILAQGESLPAQWRAAGTTGHEAAALMTGIMAHAEGFAALEAAYRARTGLPEFAVVADWSKREVLESLFRSEFEALAQGLRRLGVPRLKDDDARAAVAGVTVHLRVYRTYASGRGMPAASRKEVLAALAKARGLASDTALARLRQVLLRPATDAQRAWRLRWQQATGAVMAKGMEDRAIYRWTPLAALAEVGGAPDRVATIPGWHEANLARLRDWPNCLAAGTTHDSKRSQDLRLRLAVLSEMPKEWLRVLEGWRRALPGWPRRVGRVEVPDAHTEWLVLQTILGMWTEDPDAAFVGRLQDYAVKAAREADLHTSWLRPQGRWEEALREYVAAAVRVRKPRGWRGLAMAMRRGGAASSLSALVLQLGAPGVPDIYQGTEGWSLMLVDPDNRRPPDLGALSHALDAAEAPVAAMVQDWQDGRIKLHVLATLLRLRRELPGLFLQGEYVPVSAQGVGHDRVVAFLRSLGDDRMLVVGTRWHARGKGLVDPEEWPGTTLRLPAGMPGRWRDALTGTTVWAHHRGEHLEMDLREALTLLPACVLRPV